MRTFVKLLMLVATAQVAFALPTPVTGSSSGTAFDVAASYDLTGANTTAQAFRVLRSDLAGGTALTVGTHYYDSLTGNRTLTFSGSPASGSTTSVILLVSNAPTLTIPSCKRVGQANSAVTSLALTNGVHVLTWTYAGSTWYLSDSVFTSPLPIASGGTNATTTYGAFDNLSGPETIVASASTTDLGAVASNKVSITGTTTINSFGTAPAGVERSGRFTGSLTLTQNATSFILQGGANITTSAGDSFRAWSLGS